VKEGDTMIDGKDVRTVLLESKLEKPQLFQIW